MNDLEIIIPAYNSHKTITNTLESISIQENMPSYHVTIVNDCGENYEKIIKEYKDRSKARTYVDETFLLDFLVLQSVENPEVKNKNKRKVIEQLIANVVERTIDVNQDITEEQLKNLVARQFNVIKYKKQVSNKEIQDIFRRYISKYVQQISEKG